MGGLDEEGPEGLTLAPANGVEELRARDADATSSGAADGSRAGGAALCNIDRDRRGRVGVPRSFLEEARAMSTDFCLRRDGSLATVADDCAVGEPTPGSPPSPRPKTSYFSGKRRGEASLAGPSLSWGGTDDTRCGKSARDLVGLLCLRDTLALLWGEPRAAPPPPPPSKTWERSGVGDRGFLLNSSEHSPSSTGMACAYEIFRERPMALPRGF
mmetsp:Transcript_35327/g.67546  ORF Transcript_35327/g.67546 Transcript_35327/m.67546 type:complete len:214 (+) Transcript_35327:407-1048(+)